MLGARIVGLEPAARVALMEWCYVVCSHQEVRGTRPGERTGAEPTALPIAPPRLVPQPAASIEQVPGRRGCRLIRRALAQRPRRG